MPVHIIPLMTPKLKYEIVSWGGLVLLVVCLAAMVFCVIDGLQRSSHYVLGLGSIAVLVARFEGWYSRRMKAQMKVEQVQKRDDVAS